MQIISKQQHYNLTMLVSSNFFLFSSVQSCRIWTRDPYLRCLERSQWATIHTHNVPVCAIMSVHALLALQKKLRTYKLWLRCTIMYNVICTVHCTVHYSILYTIPGIIYGISGCWPHLTTPHHTSIWVRGYKVNPNPALYAGRKPQYGSIGPRTVEN